MEPHYRSTGYPSERAPVWLLAQKPWISPIPGTAKLCRLEENLGVAAVELTSQDLQRIETAAAKLQLKGERLSESALKMTGL